ncbi:MAG: MBL fold metallo-hydrolase [Methanocorpusculum sp.]|nr:MBL fold metallo-hydrolase [Methanocorpusculum sp.]
MPQKYFDGKFISKISSYTKPLTKSEIDTYICEGEECAALRSLKGVEPEEFKNLVENVGKYLGENSGKGFTSDYQSFKLSDDIELWSFELPGGGNLYLIDLPEGKMIIDTGYGCFFKDCKKMVESLVYKGFSDVRAVICTHGDADHCGASGYFDVPPVMHPITKALLESGTRGYHSPNGLEVLEKFYTTTINTFSRMNIPEKIITLDTEPLSHHGIFPVIDKISFEGLNFEVWESLGGHIAGQIFLYEKRYGVLFTSDALINFQTLSKERANYSSIADSMIGSVNVDSSIARTERQELMKISKELDDELKKSGRRLLIACGHGSVSILSDEGKLIPASESKHYSA